MPYVSWSEGGLLHRHFLKEDCYVGRDPLVCAIAKAQEDSLSRRHASLSRLADRWWVRDLGSLNGSSLNGLPVNSPTGNALEEGDELRFGDWVLHFTEGFPGLDGVAFIERVGSIFQEIRPEPQQALILIHGLELLQRCTEFLLQEKESSGIMRGLLDEAVKLFRADRGFLVMAAPDGAWKTVRRVGDIQENIGLSRSVLDYVAAHGVAVLSNVPLMDPRFGGSSLVEFHRGALMCAPLEFNEKVQGLLFLDRIREVEPFVRFDLALFNSFVHQGALILHHADLSTKALGQAELEGELMRTKGLQARTLETYGEMLSAMNTPLHWLKTWAADVQGDALAVLRHQVDRLASLVEDGLQRTHIDTPDPGSSVALDTLSETLRQPWVDLLRLQGASMDMGIAPMGFAWMASSHAYQALVGLVEPMLLQLGRGTTLIGAWGEEPGSWVLDLGFPAGCHGPAPDPWTARTLASAGIHWRWQDQTLSVLFSQGPEGVPEEGDRPLLGLVTEEYQLLGLFQSVVEAGDLQLYPLESEPPVPPLPRFRYLVIDAEGVKDPIACIEAYRRHPSFSTSPILVVRAPDDQTPALLAAGATDWLPEGFRWEALHHRLQVLRSHDELQRKARAVERLDSFRQLAGTLKHEINNPLAVISMQVELLQRKYPEEAKLAKIGEMVERIRGLVQMLQKMREAATVDYADGSAIVQLPGLQRVLG